MQVGNLQVVPGVSIALHETLISVILYLILAVSYGGFE